ICRRCSRRARARCLAKSMSWDGCRSRCRGCTRVGLASNSRLESEFDHGEVTVGVALCGRPSREKKDGRPQRAAPTVDASMRLMNSRILVAVVLVWLLAQSAFAQLPLARPESVALSSARLAQMDAVIADAIADKKPPGAVVLVGREGRVVWRKAYGARAVEPVREAMTPDTIFDLASLTKVVATTTSVMILMERGKLRLSDPVSLHIPELKG